MRLLLAFLLLLSGGALLPACSYDNNEDLLGQGPPEPACDSTATYTATIAPLLQQQCVNCHTTALPGGGVVLQTHPGVQAAARSGQLVGAVSHSTRYVPMPANAPKLSDCDIARIRNWVRTGALND